MVEDDEYVLNVFVEFSCEDTLEVLESLKIEGNEDINVLAILIKMFKAIKHFSEDKEVQVNTRYKRMKRKIWPVATPLPKDSDRVMKEVSIERMIWDSTKIGHKFAPKIFTELKIWRG